MDVKEELNDLLSFNPPALVQNPDFSLFPSVSPVTFYDKHLDDHLALKRIRLMPSLSNSLSRTVDEVLKSLDDREISIPASIGGLMGREARTDHLRRLGPMNDARSIAEFYRDLTAKSCRSVASTLLLHPHANWWWSVFHWRLENDGRPWWKERFATHEYALRLMATPDHDFEPVSMLTLDEETAMELQQVAKRFPQLATWDIYTLSPDVERMLEDMERLALYGPFYSEIPLTSGYKRFSSVHEIPDATTAPWTIPIESPCEADSANVDFATPVPAGQMVAPGDVFNSSVDGVSRLRRSARLSKASTANKPIGIARGPNLKVAKQGTSPTRGIDKGTLRSIIRPPSKTVKKTRKYDKTHFPLAQEFIQHVRDILIYAAIFTLILELQTQAWSQSVRDDSTLVIFHCGNFERIGVRHRKSQTLYLSEIIDVPNCDPSYFKLHVGLYITAIRDCIDRATQLGELEAMRGHLKYSNDTHVTVGGKKRLLVNSDPGATNKRHKKGKGHDRVKLGDEELVNQNDPKAYTEVCPCIA